MIKLSALDEFIRTVEGKTVRAYDRDTDITYRKALIAILEFHTSKKPGTGEPIKAILLAARILNEPEVLLHEDEVAFLEMVLEQSRVFNLAVVIARLSQYLQESKQKVEPQLP